MFKKILLLVGIFTLILFFPSKNAFAQVRSCSDAAAAAVRLSIPKTTVYVGETITFNITGDASTYITDTFNSGGVNCPAFADGNFIWNWYGTVPKTSGSISCVAQTPGNYNWVHQWRPCRGYNGSIPTNCTSGYCTAAPGSVPYSIIVSGTPTLTPTLTITPTPTTPTSTPTPTVQAYTSDYRCSDILFDKADTATPWITYQNSDFSPEPVKFSFTFTQNAVPGSNLTIYCQFRDNLGNTSMVYPKSIKYLGAEPKIKSITCGYDPAGTGTIVTINGTDFGVHSDQSDGNVKVSGKDTTINSWALDEQLQISESTESATISATPTGTITNNKYKVVTKLKEKLPNGRYQVVLTNDEGRITKGYCTLGTTTFDFSTVIQCGDKTASLAQDNVAVEVKEKVEGAKTLIKKKIKLDNEGKPIDFAPEVEIGKNYTLSVKAAKGLTRKVDFTAEEGTTALGIISLPLGDIYPIGAPDDKINAFDKAEMVRQWSLVSDVTRLGDLNGDSRVNSIDYSCLLVNYNKSGD